jgi:hypothetical protein
MKQLKNVYKEMNSFEKRQDESSRIVQKYKGKIPVVVLMDPLTKSKESFYKYLISGDLDGIYIIRLIRNKIVIDKSKGLFCLTEKNGTMLTSSMQFSEIYHSNRDEDGFLYLTILVENTFGD